MAKLLRRLQAGSFDDSSNVVVVVQPEERELPPGARQVVLICGNGCFLEPFFVALLWAAGLAQLQYVPVIFEDTFRFPSPVLLTEIKNAVPTLLAELAWG